MTGIDSFLNRRRSKNYNCLDFAAEVWLALVGSDVKQQLQSLCGSVTNGRLSHSVMRSFKELARPESPCFVVMQRFRFTPHIGVYVNERILHLRNDGVRFELPALAQSYFDTIRYYR